MCKRAVYIMTEEGKRIAIEHQKLAAFAFKEAEHEATYYAFGLSHELWLVVYWQRKAAFHSEMAMLCMLGSKH